jgi:hypothetical protein
MATASPLSDKDFALSWLEKSYHRGQQTSSGNDMVK